jgi:hypothetical protein
MIKSLRTGLLTATFLAGSFALALAQAVPEGERGTPGAGYKSGTSETGPAASPTPPSPAGAMGANTEKSDSTTGTVVRPNTGQNTGRQGSER